MKIKQMIGERFKNSPSDISSVSHAIMIRGGYIKSTENGIFSSYTPLKRVTRKIENIIYEEMDSIGGQEVSFSLLKPISLIKEAGTYNQNNKLAFIDHNNIPISLNNNNIESAIHLSRDYAVTYTKYPFMIYDIQKTFFDEKKPQGAFLNAREYTLKEAFSFHTSQEDLDKYFLQVRKSYYNIFNNIGIPDVFTVSSDKDILDDNISEDFILLSSAGETSILLCEDCDYKENLELAECITTKNLKDEEDLKLLETPECSSILELCEFLNRSPEDCCKAVVYQDINENYIVVFLRGDLEVNETKLKKYLKKEIFPALITLDSGFVEGYIGPHNFKGSGTILYDRSLSGKENLVCGGNEEGYHYVGLNINRDIEINEYLDIAKFKEGSICPKCGSKNTSIVKGLKIATIKQLGDKYTKNMDMNYLDNSGESKNPLMGYYKIGIERLAASICELMHDDFGPIWPISVAPWQVELCLLRADDAEVKKIADEIYTELLTKGIEVLYDDRDLNAGVIFADADLLGIPIRLIISPRNNKEGICELVSRDKTIKENIPYSEIINKVQNIITNMINS